jgi:hypothetical protein
MLKIDLSTDDIADWKEAWELIGRADIKVCKIKMSSITNIACNPLNLHGKLTKTGYFGCSCHESHQKFWKQINLCMH